MCCKQEIAFGSVAVRCCDAKLCLRVKRRESAGWCLGWALTVAWHGFAMAVSTPGFWRLIASVCQRQLVDISFR